MAHLNRTSPTIPTNTVSYQVEIKIPEELATKHKIGKNNIHIKPQSLACAPQATNQTNFALDQIAKEIIAAVNKNSLPEDIQEGMTFDISLTGSNGAKYSFTFQGLTAVQKKSDQLALFEPSIK